MDFFLNLETLDPPQKCLDFFVRPLQENFNASIREIAGVAGELEFFRLLLSVSTKEHSLDVAGN